MGPYRLWKKDSETSRPIPEPKLQPGPQELRAIALLADVHEKTVARYLRGQPVRPGSRARIELALQRVPAIQHG